MRKAIKKIIWIVTFFTILFLAIYPNFIKSYAATSEDVSIVYYSHVQNIGWEQEYSKKDGQLSGTEGKSLRLEAMKINLKNAPSGLKIKYQAHVQNIGWQGWKENGQTSGTEGKNLRLEAIKINLEGTKKYKIQYRVHIQNIGWQEWKEDGQVAGTEGKSLRIEAIQIKIVPVKSISVEYNSHISMIGWENDYSRINGHTSGTTGKSLGIEALKIRLKGVDNTANIQYQAHVQTVGWQDWKNEEQIAGTTGRSLNVEAIKIKLNNMPNYSVKYRVHVQNIGWQEWKSDGQVAGTTGRNLKIEAIEIKIVDKIQNTTQKGIDVSTYQDTINWKKVKENGVEFAMIRTGIRGYGVSSDGINGKIVQDSKFVENINGAINNNIEVGVYFFSQAINEQEAIEEANFTLNLIKKYKITYPIAIDTEESSHPNKLGRADNLTVEQRTKVVKAFCETIEKAGYEPMIYANKWWLKEKLDMSKLSSYSIWLAHYTGATQDDPLAKPSDYEGKYIMWQYTDKGTVDGIIGNVDMNVGYKARMLSANKEVQIIY